MAMGFRPKLGMNLQSIVAGDQPTFPGTRMPGEMGFPDMTPGQGMGAKPKGGFFKEGGMGRTIAGLIGDALLQQADMAPVYAPAMRQRQAMAAEEAQWSRRREADRADKQWEWANKPKDAPAPTEFERVLEASGVIRGTPQWSAAMARKVENTLNPMMAVQTVDANGNPAITYTPRNPVAGSAAPAAPVGKLTPITGGPTPPASGRFRP